MDFSLDFDILSEKGFSDAKSSSDATMLSREEKSEEKRGKSYYAQASRKARKRKRCELTFLRSRNFQIVGEMPILKDKIEFLRRELTSLTKYSPDPKENLKLRVENDILHAEIVHLKHLQRNIVDLLTSFDRVGLASRVLRSLNKNIFFIINKSRNLLAYTASHPVVDPSRFYDDKLVEYFRTMFLLAISRHSSLIQDEVSLHSELDFSSLRKEVRTSSSSNLHCFRVDIFDIPIPSHDLKNLYTVVDDDVWLRQGCKVNALGSLMKTSAYPEHTELLSEFLGMEISTIEAGNSLVSEIGKFRPRVTKYSSETTGNDVFFLSATDPDVRVTKESFPDNKSGDESVSVLAHSISPEICFDLEDFETRGTSLFRSMAVRKGSDDSKSHLTALFRCKISEVNYAELLKETPGEAGEFVDQARLFANIEEFQLVKFVRKTFSTNQLLHKLELFLKCCMFLYKRGLKS